MKSIWFILREILHEGLGPLKARTQRRRDFLNDTSWERACLANDYGAAELRKNQNWYSWTALGFASVLFLNAVFIPVWTGMLNVETSEIERTCCQCFGEYPEYVFVPAPYGPKLEFGKKPITITEFIMPEPAPLEEIFQDGTRKDQLLRSREKLEVKGDFWLDVDSTEAVPNIIVDVEPSITYSTSGVDKEPTPINLKEISQKIPYPMHLRGKGEVVLLRVLIDKKGDYVKHKPIGRNNSPELLEAIETKIDQIRFTPAIQVGRPIKYWVNVPFHFR